MKGRGLTNARLLADCVLWWQPALRPQRCSRADGDRRGRSPRPAVSLNSAGGNIKHVIYIQFDNTHFLRDNPNVPSDLEQMPHLLNFIRGNGTLLTNDHTVLISHTATGILTSLTGVYPDREGQPVSNSFRYFTPTARLDTRRLVQVLDRPVRPDGVDRPPDRPHAEDGQRERQDHSCAVGALHPCGL